MFLFTNVCTLSFFVSFYIRYIFASFVCFEMFSFLIDLVNLHLVEWNWKLLNHVRLFTNPWTSGQNSGVGSLSLLQGIFPTQGLNPGLPHCRQFLYQLSHKGSPRILEWEAYPSPEDLPDPGIELGSPALQVDSLPTELWGTFRGEIFSISAIISHHSCSTFCYMPFLQHFELIKTFKNYFPVPSPLSW